MTDVQVRPGPGLVAADGVPPPIRRRRKWRRGFTAWLFMLPLIAVNVLVVVGPSIATIYYSMTDWTGLGPASFIGLDNYRHAFADSAFREALIHNFEWLGLFLVVPGALGLLGSYLLSQIKRFQILFRTIFFIPYVIASVVNAAVWQNLLSPTTGIGPHVGINTAFFGNPSTSLMSVNFVVDWHWWGFLAVIFLAAMQSVDPELYDAAKVDGAGRWQQYRYITLPGIRPTLVFLGLMTVIWSLKSFDYVFIITKGGPAGSSEVVTTLMYREAFNEYRAGYAASLGLSLAFATAIVLAIYEILRRRRGWES
ncbi:MAG TPA: sugar ABC transporter permease [Jatrophihabitantaceae bacterium]